MRNLLALNLGTTLRAGGYRWVLARPDALGGVPPDPAAWAREGRVAVLKENLQRTIARVELPGGAVYLKRVRANTPRSLLREWVRPAKARLEFENMLELRGRGVATVEPLAWGAASLWPGESVLLTRAAEGATTLGEALAAPLSPNPRRDLAARFGAYLAALHAAGVRHPDPHPGNVLVGAGGEFILTDLHAVILRSGPLPRAEAALDLTLWNRYFQARASRADRARFFGHYCAAGNVGRAERRQAARSLEAATEASNLRFWHARLKRPWLANRDTAPVPGGYAVRGLDPAALARWAPDPAAVVGELAERWKDSKSAAVGPLVVCLSDARVECVAKLFRAKPGWRRLKRLGRLTPAERSWAYGHNLLDRGLPTPRPLCLVRPSRLGAALVVFERVPGALDLPAALDAALCLPPDACREVLAVWADRLADLVRAMHQRGVRQRDLKASNVVMAGAATDLAGATPVLIDLVGVEAFDRPAPESARLADSARLAASVAARGDICRGVILRFLRRYLGADAGDWKRWWRAVSAAAAAKAARNRAAGRVLS